MLVEVLQQVRNVRNDEQHVECEPERDDRKRFQDADAKEQEGEDVRARFGLARDRLDGLASDDAVADRGTERHACDNEAERQQGEACNQRFRGQDDTFPNNEWV
jgi:hypothetical protein